MFGHFLNRAPEPHLDRSRWRSPGRPRSEDSRTGAGGPARRDPTGVRRLQTPQGLLCVHSPGREWCTIRLHGVKRAWNSSSQFAETHKERRGRSTLKLETSDGDMSDFWHKLGCCVVEKAQPKRRRKRIDRSMIGEPMNFMHLTHIGSGDMAAGDGLHMAGAVQEQMRSKGGCDRQRNSSRVL